MQRRTFLALSVSTATWLLTGCGRGNMDTSSSGLDIINKQEFDTLLAIPPLLEPHDIAGVQHYNLTIQKSTHHFFDGYTTQTYGMNGSYLGPTLKVSNGDSISINYTNLLDETTTMHGHGMHVPANMDGGPHQKIEPNQTWSAQYTVKQKASTNWYHPHLMGKTAKHVYKGLAGFIIVEDQEIQALDLPKTYGVDDIPLVLQDRFFDANGQFDYSPSMREIMMGYKGDTFITNGVFNPYINVEAKEIRLRLLNGSNSTVYNLVFNDGRSFKQIATDNALLEGPITLNQLRLSPGERAEIVVDLTQSINQILYLQDAIQGKSFLKMNVATIASKSTVTPNILSALSFYNLNDAINTRTFTLSGSMGNLYINGASMNMNVINETIPLNQIEVWEVTNTMMMEHNFHIHATHFIIVERNGSSNNVAVNEKGYKDTVYLASGDSIKLMVRMTDYSDATNPYMYHCHFLEHEDAGMMGQFIVQ